MVKKLLVITSIVVLLGIVGCSAPSHDQPSSSEEAQEEVSAAIEESVEENATASIEEDNEAKRAMAVYITETGNRYHSDGCRYLRGGGIETTQGWAIDNGYTSCSECFLGKWVPK